MLLLLGDRFNHPGEKTQAKQCWEKKTVMPEHLSIKLEFKYEARA